MKLKIKSKNKANKTRPLLDTETWREDRKALKNLKRNRFLGVVVLGVMWLAIYILKEKLPNIPEDELEPYFLPLLLISIFFTNKHIHLKCSDCGQPLKRRALNYIPSQHMEKNIKKSTSKKIDSNESEKDLAMGTFHCCGNCKNYLYAKEIDKLREEDVDRNSWTPELRD